MELLKKYIGIVFIVCAVFLSTNVMADTNTTVPVSDCGVSNDVVKLFDGEICEQDVSFRMIYKMFPTVIQNFVFPVINPQYLPLVPQIEQQNLYIYQTQEIIFFEIFKATNKISNFVISIFLVWHFLVLGLLRSANDGSFLGKSWKTSSVFTKYGILIVLLLPVSTTGILVIHVLLLSILIIGIYFANFFWGVYLNYLQVGDDAIDISTSEDSLFEQVNQRESEYSRNISQYDQNYFYSFSYAKELSKIALCKQRTEKLIIQGTIPFLTESNIDDLDSCLINKVDDSSWDYNVTNRVGTQAFNHYDNQSGGSLFNELEGSFFVTSGISFGNKDFKQCQSRENNEFNAYDYECGSINVSNFSIPEGNVKYAINNSNFYEQYVMASAALSSENGDSYFNSVKEAWDIVSNNMDELFIGDGSLNAFKHNRGMIKKNASYYFHQMLMNDALVGSSNYQYSGSTDGMEKEGNFKLIANEYMKDAMVVAKGIEEFGCLSNTSLYSNAKKAGDLIESYRDGSPESAGDYSTSCLDIEKMEPIGLDPKPFINLDDEGQTLEVKIREEKGIVITRSQEALMDLTKKIYSKRSGVEKSFYISIINDPSNDLVNYLRKKGWAISGGYILKILSEKELDNKLRHALQNSTVAKTADLSVKMLPNIDTQSIMKEDDVFNLKEWPDLTYASSLVFDNMTLKPSRKDLKYVDVSQYLNDNIYNAMGSSDVDTTGTDGIIDLVLGLTIIDDLKSVVGIGETGDLSMEQISQCLSPEDGGDIECPINMINPILEITQLGHNLINISTKIIAGAILAATMDYLIMSGLKVGSIFKDKGQMKVKKKKKIDQTVKTKKEKSKLRKGSAKAKSASVGFKVLDMVSSFLQYFFKIILGMATFLLTIGFTLAYVIPMIPFVAFTIAFISWVVISLEILVIAPIWLAFLFRVEDSNRPSTELYTAGFNFVMQMFFRPALIVVAITVSWSLFSVIFLMINLTMSTFVTGFSDSGSFMSIVYGLLLLTAYSLVIYVAIKQVFNLMIMLPNKVFQKIGVQPLDSQFESNAKDTLSNFTMGGIGLSTVLSKSIGKKIKDNIESKDELKEKLKKKSIANNRELMKKNEEAIKKLEEEKGQI